MEPDGTTHWDTRATTESKKKEEEEEKKKKEKGIVPLCTSRVDLSVVPVNGGLTNQGKKGLFFGKD